MSQNIKYIKYKVTSYPDGHKRETEFGDLEISSLVSYVENLVYTFDIPVDVVQETKTYNIHPTKPVNILKGQEPIKKRKMKVWTVNPNGPLYKGFYDWLGYYPYGFNKGNGR